MLTSQNFAGLSILASETDPENFRAISPGLATEQFEIAKKAGL